MTPGQKEVYFRFYEELNDFLPGICRKKEICHKITGNPAVKDTIEAIGVPHTEVDLILINGLSVEFDYQLQDGDRISVYPVFESIDITPVIRLRPTPLRIIKFICDVHLGKLARQLRMLGFDVLYERYYTDSEMIERALKGKRLILTRDQGILKQKRVNHGYWIRSTQVQEQLFEVINKFDLCNQIKPFIRCMICNGLIKAVEKSQIIEFIKVNTARHYDEFFRCSTCNKIYWKGSHYKKMENYIKRICYHAE